VAVDSSSPTAAVIVPFMDGDVVSGFETGPARETDLDDVVGLLEAADGALGLPLSRSGRS